MTGKTMILAATCLALAACSGSNGDALSLGGSSGSSQSGYTQYSGQYSGSGSGGTGWAGSEGGLGTLPKSIGDTQLDRRGR